MALQAGLSQTDWFGLGTGLLGTGYAAAAYNQAAYLSSVALRQCQIYQKKNYELSWVSIARDDIRDMMNISVTRISNYMMVATLILGVASDALLGVNFSEKCPEFVQTAFWISMALSILFFTESIMFAVKGQNSAFTNTMRLLTWELRPEPPAPYDHDYLQQMSMFESSGLAQLFRIPGLATHYGDDPENGKDGKDHKGIPRRRDEQLEREGFLARIFGQRSENGGNGAGSSSDPQKPSAPTPSTPWKTGAAGDGSQQPTLEQVVPKTTMLMYLARFSHFMQLWQPYETSSKYCIGLGLISLAHGAAYFCLGHFSATGLYMGDCIAWITVFIFIFVTAIVYQQNFHSNHRASRWAVYLLISLGPVCGIVGGVTTSGAVRSWAASLMFLFHSVHYIVGWVISVFEFKKPWQTTKKFTTGPRGQQFPEEWFRACNQSDVEEDWQMYCAAGRDVSSEDDDFGMSRSSPPEEFYGASRPCAAERRKVVQTNNRVTGIVRSSMLFSGLVWFVTFWASAFTNFESCGLWLNSLVSGKADLLDGDHLAIVAPVPGLELTSVACRGDVMFVANSFQVFRVNISSGVLDALPCALEREVADLTLDCSSGSCRPLVLLDDSSILDCSSGVGAKLLKGMEAKRIASTSNSAEPKLLSLTNGTLVDNTWNAAQKGWDPQWVVQDVGADVVDVDAVEGRAVLFSVRKRSRGHIYRNAVSVKSQSDFKTLGKWRLRDNAYTTTAGCAMSPQVAYFVQKGEDVRLLRVRLPV